MQKNIAIGIFGHKDTEDIVTLKMAFDVCLWCVSVVVAHGLLAVMCRLSYSATCGILVPWPGIKPTSPALEGEVLTIGPPGKSS